MGNAVQSLHTNAMLSVFISTGSPRACLDEPHGALRLQEKDEDIEILSLDKTVITFNLAKEPSSYDSNSPSIGELS